MPRKIAFYVFVFTVSVFFSFSCFKKSIDTSKKVFNFPLRAEIEGFDPTLSTDLYTHEVISMVYESLLEYDYLARPYTLRPLLIEAMPEVSKDGKTYTFKLKKNVFFHADPSFKAPRVLKASDVVYSFKRLADPNVHSPNYWLLENKIVGLDEFRKNLESIKNADYDAFPVEGLTAPDDHTFVMKLTEPSPLILYSLAMAPTSIVAKEVVTTYKDELVNHPVGTGPFLLKEWRRNQKITLVKHPNYHDNFYPTVGSPEDEARGLLKAQGQKLPFVDEIVFWVYVEPQPKWLNFMKGNLDVTEIPKDAYDTAFDAEGNMNADLKKREVQIDKQPAPDLVMLVFNMKDPVMAKNPDLRKALSLAQDRMEKINLFYNGRAIEAHGPVPPGIEGYDPKMVNPYSFNFAKAKVYFEKAKARHKELFGNVPLKLTYETSNNTDSRQIGEAFIADFKKLGLDIDMQTYTWTTFTDRMKKSQGQIYSYAWSADYPDAENFLQLLYGKNVSPGPNHANFDHAEYNRLFDQMKKMKPGVERQKVIASMVKIVHEEVPWILFNHRIGILLSAPWTKNVKRNHISPAYFKYIDVDMKEKALKMHLFKQ